ncbi:MAG: metallophosphoesterase family protein [Comamonadaceae bacterium]|nr:metallophosphoesterase family protein [Comamonadaceae bacterium]
MKFALLSDIHGNLPALQAVLACLRAQGIAQVVNLGDSLSGPLWPLETAQCLMQQGWPTLAGNHERQLLSLPPERMGASDAYAHARLSPAVFDWLRQLPATLRPAPDVLLCHGTPGSDRHYFLHSMVAGRMRLATAQEIDERLGGERARLVACGHTHLPGVLQTARGQTLVNPGSVGLPAYDDDRPEPHVVENGSPHARYAVAERLPAASGSAWAVTLHAVPYDHEAAARQAERNARPDWAHALRTGRMPAGA